MRGAVPPCLALLALLAAPAAAAGVDELRAQLGDASALRRFEAARALGDLGAEARPAVPALVDLLGDPKAWVKLEAARAIVRIGIEKKTVPGLVERLELVPPEVAQLLGEALAEQPASLAPLIEALGERGSVRLRREAARAIPLMGRRGAAALPVLLDLTEAKDAALKKLAQDGVRQLAPWACACVDGVAERLRSEHPQVRWVAARLLAGAGPSAASAIPALKQAAAGEDANLANAATAALRSIDVATAAQATEALLKPNAANLRAPDTFRVTFHTSKGKVVVEVNRAWSPKGADRFYNLVKLGFFDDTRFFRVIPGFIAQFGLSGNPQVNTAWKNATIEDDAVSQTNERGTISFATAGPNTRTTQLFFNLGANGALDRQNFTPFGRVVEGLEVLDKIHAGDRSKPDQALIHHEGNDYLDREFPKLDSIERVVLEEQ